MEFLCKTPSFGCVWKFGIPQMTILLGKYALGILFNIWFLNGILHKLC